MKSNIPVDRGESCAASIMKPPLPWQHGFPCQRDKGSSHPTVTPITGTPFSADNLIILVMSYCGQVGEPLTKPPP